MRNKGKPGREDRERGVERRGRAREGGWGRGDAGGEGRLGVANMAIVMEGDFHLAL